MPNGVDVSFYDPDKIEPSGFREKNGFKKEDLIFFYGGIIGYAQGLDLLLNVGKELEAYENVKIVLQGTGPELERLKRMKEEEKIDNVFFLPPVEKSMMPDVLKEIDVVLVPLRKLDIFKGAIPSKIFEAMAMKKALLLGVEGEAKKHFIDTAEAGYFFEPENKKDLKDKILKMVQEKEKIPEFGEKGRAYVSKVFNRDVIAKKFEDYLKQNI